MADTPSPTGTYGAGTRAGEGRPATSRSAVRPARLSPTTTSSRAGRPSPASPGATRGPAGTPSAPTPSTSATARGAAWSAPTGPARRYTSTAPCGAAEWSGDITRPGAERPATSPWIGCIRSEASCSMMKGRRLCVAPVFLFPNVPSRAISCHPTRFYTVFQLKTLFRNMYIKVVKIDAELVKWWWARPDSNRQPKDYESPAPPLSYRPDYEKARLCGLSNAWLPG